MYRQSEKKLVKQQYLLQMSPQYGELELELDASADPSHPTDDNGEES